MYLKLRPEAPTRIIIAKHTLETEEEKSRRQSECKFEVSTGHSAAVRV